jgi:hypothetical protein
MSSLGLLVVPTLQQCQSCAAWQAAGWDLAAPLDPTLDPWGPQLRWHTLGMHVVTYVPLAGDLQKTPGQHSGGSGLVGSPPLGLSNLSAVLHAAHSLPALPCVVLSAHSSPGAAVAAGQVGGPQPGQAGGQGGAGRRHRLSRPAQDHRGGSAAAPHLVAACVQQYTCASCCVDVPGM